MLRHVLPLSLACSLAASCRTPTEVQVDEHVAARDDVTKAGELAGKRGEAAREKLEDAQREFGDEVAKAQIGIGRAVSAADQRVATADATAAGARASDRYPRFADLTVESEVEFDTRAQAALDRVELDLEVAAQRGAAAGDAALTAATREAADDLATARQDLASLRSKTGAVLDDGKVGVKMAVDRVGVGMAINEVQDASEAVYGRLAMLKL
ncbi:MAG: hypothetical protein JNK45_27735 [Myxococcales bacterium]|nr:hypothetical protein [Myxococcales bacterium]